MSNIARAIEEMQTERANLAARLAKVDALIVTMREMFHLPNGHKVKATKAKPPDEAVAPTNGTKTPLTDAMILAALKGGALSPGAISKQLGVERSRLRFRVAGLEQRGFVTSSGTTAARLIQLTAKAAKEAP
jgi:hypothetical protein